MRSVTRLIALGAAVAIAAMTAQVATAADPKILQDRQDLMQGNARQFVIIRNYLQGKADEKEAMAAIAELEKSVPTVPNYFPAGSEGPNPDGKYEPKPEVFSQPDKFLEADKKVAQQVAAIGAAIAGGDKAKVQAAFDELGACKACHDTFRAKLQ